MSTVRNMTQLLLAFVFVCLLQTPSGLSDMAHRSTDEGPAVAVFNPSADLHRSPLDLGVETGIRRDRGNPIPGG